MSNPRDSLSRDCLQAGNKNTHCRSALKHEVKLLEKEKRQYLQSIHHDAKQLRQQFPNRSVSPRPVSSDGGRARSASPSRRSSHLSNARASPAQNSGEARKSPQPSPLLSRRKSSAAGNRNPEAHSKIEHVFVTDLESNKLLSVSTVHVEGARSSQHKADRPKTLGVDHGEVPQIIVSDTTRQPRGRSRGIILQKRRSVQRGASPGSSPRSGADSDSELGSPPSQSPSLQSCRTRSSSMPSVTLSTGFKPPSHRPSHCRGPDRHSDLRVPESPRARGSSFSSIDPARRRGSVLEQWGSISERNRPAMGSFKGRRGSVDMENLLRDLCFGLQHNELMTVEKQIASVTDKQWEELKNCRYLRVPSRDNSEEDISQEKD